MQCVLQLLTTDTHQRGEDARPEGSRNIVQELQLALALHTGCMPTTGQDSCGLLKICLWANVNLTCFGQQPLSQCWVDHF